MFLFESLILIIEVLFEFYCLAQFFYSQNILQKSETIFIILAPRSNLSCQRDTFTFIRIENNYVMESILRKLHSKSYFSGEIPRYTHYPNNITFQEQEYNIEKFFTYTQSNLLLK